MELRRQNVKITWHGEEREIPLPAGIAVNSPWVDITHSSPSAESMLGWDYLPGRSAVDYRRVPACTVWPTNPPRVTVYAHNAFVTHPLVALVTARNWEGAPPLYVCNGWEVIRDESRFMATQFHEAGVPVVHEEYEGQPHCFGMLFSNTPTGRRNLESWGGFIRSVVEEPGTVETKFSIIKAKTREEVPTDPAEVKPYTREEIEGEIRKWIAVRETALEDGSISKL